MTLTAEADPATVGPVTVREVMARFATGVTVLTAGGENGHGMTANAFSSLSLDPPMVLCCVAQTARMHGAITRAGAFAVSILSGEQQELARYFADRHRPTGAVQFGPVGCRPGPHTGAPLMNGALAWLECELVETYAGGDHSIFLGRVLGSGRGGGSSALSFFDGEYHRLGQVAGPGSDVTG